MLYEVITVVIGPEVPLVEGLHDFILADAELKQVKVVGPQQSYNFV